MISGDNGCGPGQRIRDHLTVTGGDTTSATTGGVPVLAGWRILQVAEQLGARTVTGSVGEGDVAVYESSHIELLVPCAAGVELDVEATLLGVHGRRLEVCVVFRHGDDDVARVTHRLAVLRDSRFRSRALVRAAAERAAEHGSAEASEP